MEERGGKDGRAFTPVKFGIGLNTGECSVGNMGSEQRFDYSALGDEVNIASRLEGSSKQFGVDIVASSATRDEATEFAWLEIDDVKLKNKTRAVALYALAGGPLTPRANQFRGLLPLHEEMLAAYRARKFAAARRLRRGDAARARGGRGLYGYYASALPRCDAGASRELGADDRARRKIDRLPESLSKKERKPTPPWTVVPIKPPIGLGINAAVAPKTERSAMGPTPTESG